MRRNPPECCCGALGVDVEGHEHRVQRVLLEVGVEESRCAHMLDRIGDDAIKLGRAADRGFHCRASVRRTQATSWPASSSRARSMAE